MRVGVRVGPVWVSSGGSRRRKRRNYTAAQGAFVASMIAVVYLLVSGGWWVVLGWTLFGVSIIVAMVRIGKHAAGAQHASALGTDAREPTHRGGSSSTRTLPGEQLTRP
jgi:hypothetical protein